MAMRKVSPPADNGETAETVANGEVATEVEQRAKALVAGSSFLTDEVLRQVGASGNAFADAMSVIEDIYGDVKDLAETFGTGFVICEDKSTLEGVPFVILKTRFQHGDWGMFSTSAIVTADGRKLLVNDGSTGVCAQLAEWAFNSGRDGGWRASYGLRRSEYPTCANCGKPRPTVHTECDTCGDTNEQRGKGETFYIAV